MKEIQKENKALLKILIIEDEPVSARFIESRVRKYFTNKKISIFHEKSLIGAEAFLEEKEVDLVLLDLSLYGEDSLSVAENLKHHNTQIIIISGRLEKAIDAFEFSVLDFVPKPIDEDRLFLVLSKFKEKTKWKKNGKYLLCKTDDEIKLLPFSEIIYLKGEGKKTIIHSKNHLPITLKKNLNAVSQNLPENFYRIHKSYITRIEYIDFIRLKPETVAILKNKESIPISRRMLAELQSII